MWTRPAKKDTLWESFPWAGIRVLFSLNRIYAESILPNGKTYTFWGKGVSQGHSDAIRRVAGVKRGIQYTIPVPEAAGRGSCLRESGADHQTETHQRVLHCG